MDFLILHFVKDSPIESLKRFLMCELTLCSISGVFGRFTLRVCAQNIRVADHLMFVFKAGLFYSQSIQRNVEHI